MWFTENAWQPMLFLTLAGMMFGMVWYRRLQTRYLIAMAACFLLVGVTWFVEGAIVTEREKVRNSVVAITTSFQQRNLEQTLTHVSRQARGLQLLISSAHNLVKVRDDMRVTDIEIDLLNDNTRAKTRFRVNATIEAIGQSYVGHQPTRWEATWQLEEGEWRIINILQLDPINGNVITDFSEERNWALRMFGNN
ncbi:hypothetical protein [Thalassoglobus sp.]|uniref:hypothetical protein n=1 Tax=Thalassoglobus sp. TaxID=2795869 RepID=UPI003AA8D25B